MSGSVVVIQGDGSVQVTTPATQMVEVQAQGPMGPPGAQGPIGPPGPPGPLGPFLGHVWVDGLPRAGEVVLQLTPGEALVVGANLSNWVVYAADAAAGSPVIELKRDGVTVGTMTWSPGGNTPSLATTGGEAQTFAAEQIFSLVCPDPQDATLGRITIRVYATRS